MWFHKKNKEQSPEEQAAVQPAAAEDAFDLDEIMKEFSDEQPVAEALKQPDSAGEPAAEEVEDTAETVGQEAAETEEEMPVEEEAPSEEETPAQEGTAAPEAEEEAEEVTGDTVRIPIPAPDPTADLGDTIRICKEDLESTIRLELPEREPAAQDTLTGDTIVMEGLPLTEMEATHRLDPVDTAAAPADTTEPFSENWEPEYEQPIGEYVPPQPIVFHPKSRLRELKRQLVAGPERRYYEISEQGFVKLQAAIFVSLLVAVLSTTATVLYEMGFLAERLKLVAFGQLFGMLVAALMGTYQLMDGVSDMFRKRFSLNSLLVFSFLACIADGIFCLKQQRVPCSAAFTVQMTMSLWSTYHTRSTEMGQMDTMRKATRLDSLVEVEDFHDGCKGFVRAEGQVEDFMDHYQDRSAGDKTTSLYAMMACVISLASGVVAGVIHTSVSFGFQVLAASLLAAVPGTFFITVTRPMAILEKRLHKLGTVLCGWQRIAQLSKRAVFPLRHEDLFPGGSCKLNGVKFYGRRDPDQVVAYATAVIAAEGGGITPLFEQLLASRNGRHYDVENLHIYGGGGIGGEVCGEPVLVGMQSFLKEMGVEIPEGTMVSQAVYVAVDGELCGVFAVSCARTKTASLGLHALCSYRSLRPVLVTGDFMLTEEFIRATFGVNTRRISFPEYPVRAELAAREAEPEAKALALSTREGLASYACAVAGARSVRTAGTIGLVIHLLGGILGLCIIAVLAVLNAGSLITPVNMLLYQLVWMIPGLLVTEWTRTL